MEHWTEARLTLQNHLLQAEGQGQLNHHKNAWRASGAIRYWDDVQLFAAAALQIIIECEQYMSLFLDTKWRTKWAKSYYKVGYKLY